jgi:Flp pilus assembly protein TadD
MAGRHAEAERACRAAAELRPDSHVAHYNVGLALACQDRLRESIPHFVRARALAPASPEFQQTLFPILVTLLQEEPAPPPQWVPPPLEPRH